MPPATAMPSAAPWPSATRLAAGQRVYLAWSSKRSNEARLKELARRQAEAEKAAADRDGLMSNCALVVDPGAVCKASRCELRTDRRGGELAR